jgi:hypothetical protein
VYVGTPLSGVLSYVISKTFISIAIEQRFCEVMKRLKPSKVSEFGVSFSISIFGSGKNLCFKSYLRSWHVSFGILPENKSEKFSLEPLKTGTECLKVTK